MVSQTIPVLFNRLFCCKEAEHLDTSKASVEEHSWESAPLTQLTFAWRQLLLQQRQPSKWYRHSLTTPEPLHWQRQHNLILNTVFSLHLTAVHFPSSEVIWISLIKATRLCFVTVLTWNSRQAGTRPYSPLTDPAGSFLSGSSIFFCSPLPQAQQLSHRKAAPRNDSYYLASLRHLEKKSASVVKEQRNGIHFILMN